MGAHLCRKLQHRNCCCESRKSYVSSYVSADRKNIYKKVEEAKRMSDRKLVHSELVSLKYLRKVNLEAYSYLIQFDEILEL